MKKAILLVCFALVLSACGGTGSSTGGGAQVQGLQIPSNFSLLSPTNSNPQGAGSPAGRRTAQMAGRQAQAFSDAGTDYSTDVAHVYVNDESMDSLATINSILCALSQTAAGDMLNKGPYVALVNVDRCNLGNNNSGAGGSGSSGVTNFARWVIDAERASNDAPEIVHIWMPNPDGAGQDSNKHILVDLTITDGVSGTRPFGSFRLNFRGVFDVNGTEVPKMQGMLETVDNAAGQPQFRFLDLEGDALNPDLQSGSGDTQSANVRLADATGTAGLALTHLDSTWSDHGTGSEQHTYAVAYNAANFLSARDDNGDQTADAQVCRSRDQFDTRIWNYALYHQQDGTFRGSAVTAGQRVDLNSGFPFSYDSDANGTQDKYGWVGYNGVWSESQQSLADGQAIKRFDYSSNATSDYTIHVSPGKLTRRTSNQAPLSDFAGDQFTYWGPHPTLGISGQWAVTLDQSLAFAITATITNGSNGPTYSDTIDNDGDPNTPPVSVAATFTLGDNQTLWLWSDALGGSVVYRNDTSVAAANREVTYFAQETVAPNDAALFPAGTGSLTLFCYDRCLIGGLTQADVDAAGNNQQALYHQFQGQPFTYTLAAQNGKVTLTDDANSAVVDATGLVLDSVGSANGIGTGEMLTAALADPSQPWLVTEQPLTYHWDTGGNDWNRLITAVDSGGVPASFDKPIQISYTHLTANDANGDATYDGKRFLLNYGGAGNLGGIPGVQDSGNGRWYPLINLADGVMMSDSSNGFVVRGLEMEQSMRNVDISQCAGLDAAAAYTDTGLALPTAADLGTVTFTLADEPTVTSAPAVIDGVLQGT